MTLNLTTKQHRWIYLASLAMIAIGLPFSRALISIGEIILVLNFLLEGRWAERWERFRSNRTAQLFIGFYLLHIIGLLWSTDFEYAFDDLRVKVPLLIFPLIIPLSQKLNRGEFLWIAALFTAAVVVASFISTYLYFDLRDEPNFNYRDISLFTSHIRYSLMVSLSYIILLNCAWNEEKQSWLRVVYILLAIWMSVFIFILQSMTGIVVWLLCSYMLLFYTLFYLKNPVWRITGISVLWITPLFVVMYLAFQIDAFYPDKQPSFASLEERTPGGELYEHDTTNLTLENGYYINLYVSPWELDREWKKISDIPYWGGEDARGHAIQQTLIRYLTSKGLRKDSVGVSKLTEEDIQAIERGIANVRFLYGNALDNRIYTVIWEFDKMMQEKLVQGHSVTQRLEFWRTGWQIFRENMWVGVGTGDVNEEFQDMYDRMDSRLSEKYRLRSHNQFLNILVAFGIPGFLLFALSILMPFLRLKNANTFLYIGFSIVIYASMLNEDTLETQVGVTLYAFFNAFFLYSMSALSPASESTSS